MKSCSIAAAVAVVAAIGLSPTIVKADEGEIQFVDAAQLAAHQYFYVDFPRRLAAIADERTLLEAEVRALEQRVDSYRPFRSFGRYSPAHTADVRWQLTLQAARQRLACLQNAEADLWRQRQLTALGAW